MRKLDLLIAEGNTAHRQESAQTLDALLRLTSAERWTMLFRRDPRLGRLLLNDYQVFLQSLPVNSELVMARDAVAGQGSSVAEEEIARALGEVPPGTPVGEGADPPAGRLRRHPVTPATKRPAVRRGRGLVAGLVFTAGLLFFAVTIGSAVTELRRRATEGELELDALAQSLDLVRAEAAALAEATARIERQRFKGIAELLAVQDLEAAILAGRPYRDALDRVAEHGPYPRAVETGLDRLSGFAAEGLPAPGPVMQRVTAGLARLDPPDTQVGPIRGALHWLWAAVVGQPAMAQARPDPQRLADARADLARQDPVAAIALLQSEVGTRGILSATQLAEAEAWAAVPRTVAGLRRHILQEFADGDG